MICHATHLATVYRCLLGLHGRHCRIRQTSTDYMSIASRQESNVIPAPQVDGKRANRGCAWAGTETSRGATDMAT
jgi:hypothetical protein